MALCAGALAGCNNQTSKELTYEVNAKTAKAEWKGSAPDHFHIGAFQVTGSFLANSEGQVTSGNFVIPMASIQNFDLPDPVKQTLLADLKGNFFKLATHPDARFHLTKAVAYTGTDTSALDSANYQLTGDFTMLDQTHPVSFPAKITLKGDSLITEARFNLDRTKWGMNNYDDPKQKLYILPEVNIHLLIPAVKSYNTKQ